MRYYILDKERMVWKPFYSLKRINILYMPIVPHLNSPADVRCSADNKTSFERLDNRGHKRVSIMPAREKFMRHSPICETLMYTMACKTGLLIALLFVAGKLLVYFS